MRAFSSKWQYRKEICYRIKKIYRLLACSWALFSPETLQAGAVKGLNQTKENCLTGTGLTIKCSQLITEPYPDFCSQATNTNTKHASKSRPRFYYQFLYHKEDRWTLGSSRRRGDKRWWPDRSNSPHRGKGRTHSAAVAHTWNKPPALKSELSTWATHQGPYALSNNIYAGWVCCNPRCCNLYICHMKRTQAQKLSSFCRMMHRCSSPSKLIQ